MSTFTRKVLDAMTSGLGEDFNSYSASVAHRVILGRLTELRMEAGPEYLAALAGDGNEQRLLGRLLRVRYSTFFRDPLQFELLRRVVIPGMLTVTPRRGTGALRVWSAACAGGEEPYSLAILLAELEGGQTPGMRYHIFASDIAEDGIAEANAGIYSPDKLGQVTLERLANWFSPEGGRYRVVPGLRDRITFSRHDMLDARTCVPPDCVFGGFDLVLCRNFLMYLDPVPRERLFDQLYRAVVPGGLLMLGTAEAPPERYAGFWERLFDFGCLYRRKL